MKSLYESILGSTNSGKIKVSPMDFDTKDYGEWTDKTYNRIIVDFKNSMVLKFVSQEVARITKTAKY